MALAAARRRCQTSTRVEVDVIVPVHNAAATLRETLQSALHQLWPVASNNKDDDPEQDVEEVEIYVCCYNDASTDDSWSILQEIQERHNTNQETEPKSNKNDDDDKQPCIAVPTYLCIASSPEGSTSRGAGYARNRAVELRPALGRNKGAPADVGDDDQPKHYHHQFLCWLDSDDLMHPTRVYHQISTLLSLSESERQRTLLGCHFDRLPSGATWHYTHWANHLLLTNGADERLSLERFREVTLIQPTWMMCRSRFVSELGGYLEAPSREEVESSTEFSVVDWLARKQQQPGDEHRWRLVHPAYETPQTLRVAEDLRFFHEHLRRQGRLQMCRPSNSSSTTAQPHQPLVTYRHRLTGSQSQSTPRKLLLHLRAAAWEATIFQDNNTHDSSSKTIIGWNQFVVWGAGRDGKDFVKALSPQARRRVYCMVDVDDKKIEHGFYVCNNNNSPRKGTKEDEIRIPIVHFSLLAKDDNVRDKLYHAWEHGEEDGTERTATATGDADGAAAGEQFGRIDKTNSLLEAAQDAKDEGRQPSSKKRRKPNDDCQNTTTTIITKKYPGLAKLDRHLLPHLPVVVCVAMYRTGGALEANVKLIGRTEGKDLWHFS